jgi:hypothetical protein
MDIRLEGGKSSASGIERQQNASNRKDPARASDTFMKIERRKKPRLNEPVSVIVRSAAGCGKNYRFNTTAKNIAAGGLCAIAPRVMEVGDKVTLFVRFALAGGNPLQAPVIAARAVVVRVEEQCGDSCTFAASFLRHRFV